MRLHAAITLLAATLAAGARAEEPPLDYATLTHAVAVDSLRAGAHDPSGVNEYVFGAVMYALLNSSEERNAPFEKRKKIEVDLGRFGETKIESLGHWRPDDKAGDAKLLKIEGQGIRELTARAMQELKVKEGDVAVMVEITMTEKSKRFVFFGDDTVVAKTSYYPIPPTKFDAPLRTNQVLTMADDQGTLVKLGVRFDKPAAAAAATPPKGTPPAEGGKAPAPVAPPAKP